MCRGCKFGGPAGGLPFAPDPWGTLLWSPSSPLRNSTTGATGAVSNMNGLGLSGQNPPSPPPIITTTQWYPDQPCCTITLNVSLGFKTPAEVFNAFVALAP